MAGRPMHLRNNAVNAAAAPRREPRRVVTLSQGMPDDVPDHITEIVRTAAELLDDAASAISHRLDREAGIK